MYLKKMNAPIDSIISTTITIDIIPTILSFPINPKLIPFHAEPIKAFIFTLKFK